MSSPRRQLDPWLVGALVVVSVPIVVAAVRAVAQHWIPIGDDALVAIRARDVLTANHPWLGTWTSASIEAGVDMNHPGPLLFDALAVPVRLFGGHAGVAIGVMIVNLLAAWTVVGVAWRRAGSLGAVLGAGAVAFLGWTMGSELLFDPWNPHVLLLPCLALLAGAWSLAGGGWGALPVFVALGSFCVQTHLGYVYFVPGVLVVALVLGELSRRLAPSHPPRWPSRRVVLVTIGVAVVLWFQPLGEQLFGPGEGNLSRLAGSVGSGGPTIGGALGVRIFASALAVAPWDWRAAFIDAVPHATDVSPGVLGPVDNLSLGASLARLAVVVVVVAAAGWWAWRRRDRIGFAALGIAGGAMLVSLVTLAIMPIGPVGLTPHQMRWLWPTGVFAWFAVLLVAGRSVAAARVDQRIVLAVGGAVAVLFAALNLPAFVQPAGPATRIYQIPTVGDLDGQLRSAGDLGTVWFDAANLPLFDNYAAAVLAQLQADGVQFRVDDPGLIRQLGERRRLRGDAETRLFLLEGRDALDVPAGDRVVALSTPLSAAEQDELRADEGALVAFAVAAPVGLNEAGEAARAEGRLPVDPSSLGAAVGDPRAVVVSGVLPALVRDGYVDADPATVAAATRYAELLTEVNAGTTVAVVASPIG
jgi:hypothetical protein